MYKQVNRILIHVTYISNLTIFGWKSVISDIPHITINTFIFPTNIFMEALALTCAPIIDKVHSVDPMEVGSLTPRPAALLLPCYLSAVVAKFRCQKS